MYDYAPRVFRGNTLTSAMKCPKCNSKEYEKAFLKLINVSVRKGERVYSTEVKQRGSEFKCLKCGFYYKNE